MKRIICELCEGTEFVKFDGLFTCNGCGARYTVEEARGLMKDVAAENIGTSQTNEQVVIKYDEQQLENILVLATSAYDSNNLKEAEKYCNKAIEIDAFCCQAWFLKAKAVGWQSHNDMLRIEEAAHFFGKAIENAPQEQKDEFKEKTVQELKNLGNKLLLINTKKFLETPARKEFDNLVKVKDDIVKSLKVLSDNVEGIAFPHEYLAEIATIINDVAVESFQRTRIFWDKYQYQNKQNFDTYLYWLANIECLFYHAINMCDENDETNIVRYENLIVVLNEPMSACAYKQVYVTWKNEYEWVIEARLSQKAKDERRNQIKKCESAIRKINDNISKKEAEEKKKRAEDYWSEHREIKAELESQKNQLEDQKVMIQNEISELDMQILKLREEEKKKIQSKIEEENIYKRIKELESQRSNLGVFAIREKTNISNEIDALIKDIDVLRERAQKEQRSKTDMIQRKTKDIKNKKNRLQDEVLKLTIRIVELDKQLSDVPE